MVLIVMVLSFLDIFDDLLLTNKKEQKILRTLLTLMDGRIYFLATCKKWHLFSNDLEKVVRMKEK